MQVLYQVFGEGKELTTLQMCSRSIAIFIVALILIRISGRRSFGIRTPMDNIIVILLGAILSRAIVGVSPFFSTVAASFVLVILHRIFAFAIIKNKLLSHLMDGKKIELFKEGSLIKENLTKALVCKEDIMQGIRKSALTEDLSKIEKVYMERNGEISAIKKE